MDLVFSDGDEGAVARWLVDWDDDGEGWKVGGCGCGCCVQQHGLS